MIVSHMIRARWWRALAILTLILDCISSPLGLSVGSQHIDPASLFRDSFSRTLFFRLRLPRVLLGLVIGSSLALTGGALQALFRNPLADPYTLGVSGGGALGASIAIALGWSARVAGVPLVFAASFTGAMVAVSLVQDDLAHGGGGPSGGALAVGRGRESDRRRGRLDHRISHRSQQRAAHSPMADRQPGYRGPAAHRAHAVGAGARVAGAARCCPGS